MTTQTPQNQLAAQSYTHVFVGSAMLLFILAWSMFSSGDVWIFVDVPSGLFVLGITAAGLWMSFGPSVTCGAFTATISTSPRTVEEHARYAAVFARGYQLVWGAGLVGVLLGIIIMCQNMSDPSKVGPGLSVAMLTILYAAILAEFIFAPLSQYHASRASSDINMVASLPRRSLMGLACATLFAVMTVFLVLVLQNS